MVWFLPAHDSLQMHKEDELWHKLDTLGLETLNQTFLDEIEQIFDKDMANYIKESREKSKRRLINFA